MPKLRDVLTHVEVETASRKRKCHHSNKHSIPQGDECLVVHGGAYNSGKNYCIECAEKMLDLADKRFAEIRNQLGL